MCNLIGRRDDEDELEKIIRIAFKYGLILWMIMMLGAFLLMGGIIYALQRVPNVM
jgi:hypothetical protein